PALPDDGDLLRHRLPPRAADDVSEHDDADGHGGECSVRKGRGLGATAFRPCLPPATNAGKQESKKAGNSEGRKRLLQFPARPVFVAFRRLLQERTRPEGRGTQPREPRPWPTFLTSPHKRYSPPCGARSAAKTRTKSSIRGRPTRGA